MLTPSVNADFSMNEQSTTAVVTTGGSIGTTSGGTALTPAIHQVVPPQLVSLVPSSPLEQMQADLGQIVRRLDGMSERLAALGTVAQWVSAMKDDLLAFKGHVDEKFKGLEAQMADSNTKAARKVAELGISQQGLANGETVKRAPNWTERCAAARGSAVQQS
jgi:hypothetical protein